MVVAVQAWGMEIALARLFQYNPAGETFVKKEITTDLFDALRKKDTEGMLSLSRIKKGAVPKSILEAAQVSEREDKNFLLYGFLKVTGRYYDFEIKLYDRKAGKTAAVFYAKEGASGYRELVQVMAQRVVSWFYRNLGVARRKAEAAKERGVIDLTGGAGYWLPFKPWGESLLGLGSIYVSSSLTPVSPLFVLDIFRFSVSYGLSFGYAPGMNRDGYEGFVLHTVRMGFPVTLSAVWYTRNRVCVQLVPELQFDILIQDRLYSTKTVKKSGAFSLSASAGYEYLFTGSRFSLGLEARFHAGFYTVPLLSAEPVIYCRYRFPPVKTVKKGAVK